MDDLITEHVVMHDGVVSLPLIEEEKTMAEQVDLPVNVASTLLTESTGNIQNTNLNGRNIANIAMGSLQAGVAKVHNEIGTEESRAISGVMATPVAPPATQG